MGIRMATAADTAALLAIYGQYIDTSVTFEYSLPTLQAFAARIDGVLEAYPYLVWEEQGRILGYAYAHRQMERAAYQWNAELSIYLDAAAARRGLGRRLYGALLELLTLQGILTAHALVTVPNPPSQAFHGAMGFREAAVQRLAGYKAGGWHAVVRYERELAPHPAAPRPPLRLSDLEPSRVAGVLEKFSRETVFREKT